jgi:hypothetical protein
VKHDPIEMSKFRGTNLDLLGLVMILSDRRCAKGSYFSSFCPIGSVTLLSAYALYIGSYKIIPHTERYQYAMADISPKSSLLQNISHSSSFHTDYNISRHGHTLSVRYSSKTKIYVPEFPHLQFKQLYRVSHVNSIGIVLTAFLII